MDELDRRRLNRLNAEYKQSPDYIEPVFSSRRLAVMAILGFVSVAIVAWSLLDG